MAKFNFASLEKKESKDEITTEDKNQNSAPAHPKKMPKPNLTPKNSTTAPGAVVQESFVDDTSQKTGIAKSTLDLNIIDNKINEIVNDRILKLVKLGLKHELTIENLIQHFKETGKLKQYNLTRFFSDANPGEIDQMLKFLYTTKILRKDRNGWYRLKNAPPHNFSKLSK